MNKLLQRGLLKVPYKKREKSSNPADKLKSEVEVYCIKILKYIYPTFPNPSVLQFGRVSLIYLNIYR